MSAKSGQVTELLQLWSEGDTTAREELVPLVYDELRRMAKHLSGSGRDQTLQSTRDRARSLSSTRESPIGALG